jgi:hypothetical protein
MNFTCTGYGSSTLHFNSSTLYNSALEDIPHVVTDGTVTQGHINLHSEIPLTPIHMHNNKSLIPIHMHSNVTLTPIHMHFIGPEDVDPILDPICTDWHELYPEYCLEWHLSSWEDNGDGFLSPSDQIDMTPYGLTWEEMWDIFWSKGDVNRDGFIDDVDLDIIAENYGWTGPPGENPADINSDGKVDMQDMFTCAANQGLNIWTYFNIHWYHVDRVTLTLNVSKTPGDYMLIEFKGSYKELYYTLFSPIGTLWHEIYPTYSNAYNLTAWDWWTDDNCNGVLDVCDYIWLYNQSSGLEERYHVEDICYDIILNEKLANPLGTWWHELYPNYCEEWNLTSWKEPLEDPYPLRLSPGDQIDMINPATNEKKWYHVDRVTFTMLLSNVSDPEITMYIEYKGSFKDMYRIKTDPWGSLWHEIWPSYSEAYEVTDWYDNCNGVVDYCDWLFLESLESPGSGQWWHVENVTYDILVKKVFHDVAVTNVFSWFSWVY